MNIIQSILTNTAAYKKRYNMTAVKGLVLHSVGCPQPKASVFVKNWNTADRTVCVHGFIDALTGDVYQTLPWETRAAHVGGSANNTHIGVEMCEPDCIKYTSGANFTCSDTSRAKTQVTTAYNAAVELFAYLCKEYGLDPTGKNVIISHSEAYTLGWGSNHGDPVHLWKGLSMSYTMDGFRKDVKAALAKITTGTTSVPDTTNDSLYRVQLGAYTVKTNADAMLTKVKAAGFTDAFVKNIGGLYKIQIGAYSVKTNADNMLAKVKAAGYTDAFITTNTSATVAASTVTASVKVDLTTIAKEVIAGKWGNGQDRIDKLTYAGYDASEVQKIVNSLMK
jgi:hypothetical protein